MEATTKIANGFGALLDARNTGRQLRSHRGGPSFFWRAQPFRLHRADGQQPAELREAAGSLPVNAPGSRARQPTGASGRSSRSPVPAQSPAGLLP